jgi:hypothetical protein
MPITRDRLGRFASNGSSRKGKSDFPKNSGFKKPGDKIADMMHDGYSFQEAVKHTETAIGRKFSKKEVEALRAENPHNKWPNFASKNTLNKRTMSPVNTKAWGEMQPGTRQILSTAHSKQSK